MKNFLILLFFIPLFSAAQKTHKVAAKESIYSIARKYNVHPRELATFNNIALEVPLALGQVIRIPANKTMAPLTTPVPGNTETIPKTISPATVSVPAKQASSFPVYHKVAKKETLYHISKTYPGITIADIKKWNNLTADGVSEGTNLIVGYSKTESTKPVENEVAGKQPTEPETKPTVIKAVEPEKKIDEKVVIQEPAKKEEIKSITGKNFNGGVFKSLYTQQTSSKNSIAEEKGAAGIFKSTSGWEDGKYYCLTNAVSAGTIVKITYPSTQRSVYAKVLDLIPDLKQNTGMIIRISNSAAEELGASMDNFQCTLNF